MFDKYFMHAQNDEVPKGRRKKGEQCSLNIPCCIMDGIYI